MKPRARQTAQEVERTAAMLDQKLEGIGLASQPEVVLRLLKMISDPSSQIQDFAKVMRTDHAIAGRVLKLANSAIFAQRTPVTTLERACLVLGLERLKYLAVGFHLSRGAAGGAATAGLERALWGASVLRACMASELARVVAPSSVPESFVVGLMMDAGQPLMLRLLGETYQKMLVEYPEPGRLFLREGESLEFTHVDMIGALARRWRFPDLLAKPLIWHHTRPPEVPAGDSLSRLHRLSYVVGMMNLGSVMAPRLTDTSAGLDAGARLLGLSRKDLDGVVARCTHEYGVTSTMFSDVAASLGEGEQLAALIERSLEQAIDIEVQRSLEEEQSRAPRRISFGGQTIEIETEPAGTLVAYLYDSQGQRLISHRMLPGGVNIESLLDGLGLAPAGPEDAARLEDYLRRVAA